MNTVMIEPYCRYQATVRIRRGDTWPVKPEAELLDGKRITVTTGWQFVDDDADIRPEYEGEWAMIIDRNEDPGVGWISSGDLVDLVNVSWSNDV